MASAQSVSIDIKIGGGLASLGGSDWRRDALDWLGGDNEIRLGFPIGMFFNCNYSAVS